MTIATAILIFLALLLFGYAWRRGDGSHRQGVRQGWETVRRTLPLLLVAFAIVGYVNVLSPQSLVQRWIGPDSGWQGLLFAEFVGAILPGGPYVVFPLIAALYRTGAGLAPAITMVTSWATIGLISVAFEIPFLGWRFTLVRWPLALTIPLLAGGLVLYIN